MNSLQRTCLSGAILEFHINLIAINHSCIASVKMRCVCRLRFDRLAQTEPIERALEQGHLIFFFFYLFTFGI